ncbi:MAG: tyrosine phosphatase family-domain-containing protein, partial [Benniella sp.]
LTPPEQFGIVEPGLYRSDTLNPTHFPFIRSLNLKTAILLTPELPSRAMSNFFEENQIRLVDLALGSWKNNSNANANATAPFQTSWWKPLSEELIKEGLEMVLDAKNYPIIVMDTSGIHEIGTFMGCLRRLQHWNFSSIIVEYRAYAGSKARYVNEQFIELFDVDWITLPESPPAWWIEQEQMWHEEEEERELQLQQEREKEALAQRKEKELLTLTAEVSSS